MDVRDIDDIIEFDIVDKMDLTVKVNSVIPISSNFKLTLCELKYTRLMTEIYQDTVSGIVVWQIVSNSFESDGSFIVSNPDPLNTLKKGDVLRLKKPYYFRGTPLAVNEEWRNLTPFEMEKLPMIWLAQPVDESWENNSSAVERNSECTLFFLASANFRDDRTKEHRIKQVVPLMNMAHVFTDYVKESLKFGRDITYKTRDYSRFGRETQKGIEQNIIDSELSGVRLQITLAVNKSGDCNC